MSLLETKVFSVLQKFDKYEQNRCRKYIYSPYFNSNEQLRLLYDILVKEINKPSKKGLTKEVVWKKIYTNKKYDDVRMRKHTSDLMKLVENYLTQQAHDNNNLKHSVDLLKAVQEKNLTELYSSSIRSANYSLDKYKSLSAGFYLNCYRMEDYSFSMITDETNLDQKPLNYTRSLKSLDQFFLAEKLRIYCSILSRQSITSHDYTVNFIEEVTEYVSKNLSSLSPPVKIYYRMMLMYTQSDNTDNYYEFRKLLKTHSLDFPNKEAYHLYTSAINFCALKINDGQKIFYKELYETYKEMIDNNTIYKDGKINPFTFKNIVTVAANLRHFEWAENFIENNKNRIPEDQRENLVTFNLARLFFTQKKHQKVIKLLREVEYSDVSLSLQAKSFLLMTYYDIDEHEPLESMLESFRVYLNRHKEIPEPRVIYHKNLIKFTKKLTRIIPGDKEAVAKIKKEIEETENFRVRWLEEKIAELE